ncbi:MAG: DUF2079 domain-containing protein [Candidatus Omnitrophota bacterium]
MPKRPKLIRALKGTVSWPRGMKSFQLQEAWATRLVWILVGLYTLVFCFVCAIKYKFYIYNDFDLAVHDQVMWNLCHGSLYSSILRLDFLGNHAHLILFFLVPIYKLFASPLTLLFIQTLLMALGAIPLFLLARSVLGSAWFALSLATAYLFYPGLGYTNLFEFHPPALAIFFLLWMLYFYHRNRFGIFVLFMVLAMLCQENVPLGVIMVGLLAAVNRRRWFWIVVPLLGGAAYFLFAIKILMPHFNKGVMQFLQLYAHLGSSYGEVIANIIKHPIMVLRIMLAPVKLWFLFQLFAPVAFLCIASPIALAVGLPLFMQHLLSMRVHEITIVTHYTADVIPYIFFAAVFGFHRLMRLPWLKKFPAFLAYLVVVTSIGLNFWLGPQAKIGRFIAAYWPKKEVAKVKEAFVQKIPPGKSVVATFEFLPHLTHRRGLYSFHHVYQGLYTMSSQAYTLPEDVEYALIDFNDVLTFYGFVSDPNINYQNLRNFLNSGSWGVLDAHDTIVLLHRNSGDRVSLYEVSQKASPPTQKTSANIKDEIELVGFDVRQDRFPAIDLTLYWHCLKKTEKNVNLLFHLFDVDGISTSEFFRPVCYRIYPSFAWKPGEWITEKQELILPSGLPPGSYVLLMGFYNFHTGELFRTNPQDPLGRIYITEITIPSS